MSHQLPRCDFLRRLPPQDADKDWPDRTGKSPLFWAIEGGKAKLVQLYLDRGANVLRRGANGWTVLHTAANKDCAEELLQLLLSHPAIQAEKAHLLGAGDKTERTPLHVAALKDREGQAVRLQPLHMAQGFGRLQ